MNLPMASKNIATACAVAATLTIGLATPAGAATLNQLHSTGCVPVTWPQPGENTIGYGGGGRAACAGRLATVTYDPTPGAPDPVVVGEVFDLGSGVYHVDPALWCGQVDVWVDDVSAEINTPAWDPANRLITVRFAEPCAPTPVTVARITPTPDTVLESTPTTAPERGGPVPPSTTPPVEEAPPATTPGVDQVSDGPVLPVTGRATRTLAVIGFVLLFGGTAILAGVASASWLRRRGR